MAVSLTVCEIFSIKKSDLENWVRGRSTSFNILLSHSRSFEMTLMSRARVSPYWYFIETILYVIPFMRYSASKNGVTLKLRVGVVQGHWKWRRSIDHTRLSMYWSAIVSITVCCSNFQVIWCWIILTLKGSLKVIETGAIQKLMYSFLFAFHSNYGGILYRLRDIQDQRKSMTLKTGLGVVQCH